MENNQRKKGGKFRKAVFQSPQHKMGVKVLDETQLFNVFPSYDNLIDRINNHRKYVRNQREKVNQLGEKIDVDEQYNMMFDNVFSIMGKRGSGKTSAVYTLKKMFEDKRETDIVLPIIISELIPESSDTIGWILALLEDTVHSISKQLSEKRVSSDIFKDCRVKTEYSLKEIYDNVKELSYSKSYDATGEESFSKAVFNFERRTQNSFDFSRNIAKFWSRLVKDIRELNSMSEEEEPLVYIIFDDVDLTPERVWELLSTIVKYLSHPNVVVIVTAEEKMLYAVVKNILYLKMKNKKVRKKIVSPNNEWFEEMAKLYVDKILPPATRYYIDNFETCSRKAMFIESLKFTNNGEIGRVVHLQNFLEDLIKCYYVSINRTDEEDFLHYKGEFIKAYLLFWGDTSRQLANECFIVEELINSLIKIHKKFKIDTQKKEYMSELFHVIYYFVFSSLNANSGMSSDSLANKKLVDKLVVLQPEGWEIYLDYNFLYERFEKIFNSKNVNVDNMKEGDEKKKNHLQVHVKETISLYMLLFFVENILLLERECFNEYWKTSTDKIHGQYTLVTMLDKITRDSYSLVRRDKSDLRMQKFLYSYGTLLEKTDILMEFDLCNVSKVRQYLEALDQKIDEQGPIYEYCINNPKWFRTMVKVLYLSQTGIYNISYSRLFDSDANRIRHIYDKGLDKIERDTMQLVCDYLAQPGKYSFNDINEDIEFMVPLDRILVGKPKDSDEVIKLIENEELVKEDIIQNVKYYRELLVKLYPNITNKELNYILESVKNNGTEFFSSEIMDIMQRITWYKIIDIEEFKNCIREIEENTRISFDYGRINVFEGVECIEVGYLNHILSTILKTAAAIQDEFYYGYIVDRQYRLSGLYEKLKRQVCMSLQLDKTDAIGLLIAKKLYSYMKILELSGCITTSKGKTEQNVLRCSENLYKVFFKKVMQVAGPKNVGKTHFKTIIRDCIREGVEEYIYKLSGED